MLSGRASRRRTTPPPPLTDELPCQWGLGTFRTQEQWTAKRRAKPITEGAKQVRMQRGDIGYMKHLRRGLIGAVQDWARGSKANVVKILLGLIKWFGVEDEMRKKLGVQLSRAAKLDAEIVDRLADGLLFRMAHPLRILLLALCLTIAGFMASRLALRLYDLQ